MDGQTGLAVAVSLILGYAFGVATGMFVVLPMPEQSEGLPPEWNNFNPALARMVCESDNLTLDYVFIRVQGEDGEPTQVEINFTCKNNQTGVA